MITEKQKCYIAGFIDGDGSIYVKLTKNKDYKYGYQISPYVVFYQSGKNRFGLEKIKQILKFGYIRKRKDGIVELIIGDVESIKTLMEWIKPCTILKRKNVALMLDILEKKKEVKTSKDFLKLCKLIDGFKKLNYSKRRINTANKVRKIIKQKSLLTP